VILSDAFLLADDDVRDADLAGRDERLTQQHVAFLGFLARYQHVGLLEILGADRIGVDECGDLDRLVAFRCGGAQVLVLEHDVAALVVLERLDDVLPRHFLSGLAVDALVADRRIVAAVEHAEMQVRAPFAGHQPDRYVKEAERQRAGPDRSRHGILRMGRRSAVEYGTSLAAFV